MNRLRLKKHVVDLLRQKDLGSIRRQLQEVPAKQLLNPLFSCLCHTDELVRWHAVSGFGFVVPEIGAEDLEQARTVMRRFLWMLNDESGGIGWGVPEAMAEVMFHSRPLAGEYLHMLVSYSVDDGPGLFQDGNFLELDLIQEGVLWGLCRVAPVYRNDLVNLKIDASLACYFHSSNARVRGLACRLTGQLGLRGCKDHLLALREDKHPLRIYNEGCFEKSTVGDLAGVALEQL
jgi:hypothetical protein